MSNHQADAVAERELASRRGARLRGMRVVVASSALLLGVGGLAACGDDDDDASDTVPGQSLESVSSAPASEPTTTRAPSTTAAASTTRPSTTAAVAAATSAPDEGTAPTGSAAAVATTEAAATGAAAAVETTAAAPTTTAAATDTSAPAGTAVDSTAPSTSEPTGTATESSGPTTSAGPTTTGPECQFTENDEFPLERCDAGPAIAALQSVLQALEYEIGTVDCLFGDQTLYAVQAFQADEELPADGVVDEDTWAALDIQDSGITANWGTDENGNGTLEPNEITLQCA